METAACAGLCLNVRKSAVAVLHQGQLSAEALPDGTLLATFAQLRLPTDIYRYLGVPCNVVQNDAALKQQTRAELLRRVTLACTSPLAGVHRINLINSFALSLLNYTLEIVFWTHPEMEVLDCDVRRVLTRHHVHFSKAPIARLFLPRTCNGRDLRSLAVMWQTSVVRIHGYLTARPPWIYTYYPNSTVLHHLGITAASITAAYQTEDYRNFRNIYINRLAAALADQEGEKRRSSLLARTDIAKESKAWNAEELIDAEYESVYFALYDQRVR